MDATKLFGGFIPPSITGLLSLTSGDRKNKRTEFDVRRLTLCHAKVGGGKNYYLPWRKCWGEGETHPPNRPPQVCYRWLQVVEKIKNWTWWQKI